MEKYNRGDRIGNERNSMKRIYKYHCRNSGRAVVVKRLMLEPNLAFLSEKDADPSAYVEEIGVPIMTIREISLLKTLEHDNIARLLEIDYEAGDSLVRLVMEYADMDLRKFLEEYPMNARNQKFLKKLLRQLLDGITYYHSIGAVHGDLNAKNVLIDVTNGNLKLLNMALDAKALYTAPELLLGSTEASPASDMFAVGCIFAEMVNQKPLFEGGSANIYNIFSLLGTPTEEDWRGVAQLHEIISKYDQISPPENLSEEFPNLEPDGLDLISKLLCLDPSKRIKAAAALKHDYLKN